MHFVVIKNCPSLSTSDSRSQQNFLNPSGQDSRFKIPKKLLESMGVGFKIQDPKKASQGALTISPNLAQSSALVEAKRFQIAIENLINMNSTNSHY
jgi:translation initiation factor 2 beta subunit (eIF-2beta)/eIF-5